jgi:RHS repeat-associated protein
MRIRSRVLISMAVVFTLVVTLLQVVGFGPFSVEPTQASVSPTMVSLASNKSTFIAGQTFTLTATTDVSVQLSGSSIEIVDQSTYTTLKTCVSGKVCSVSTGFATGDPHVYVARVASLSSDAVTVSREPWSITLTSSRDDLIAGQKALLTATANQSVTGTDGAFTIDIFDITAGTRLKSCAVGKVCAVYGSPFYIDDEHAHNYVAAIVSTGTASSLSEASDVQAVSDEIQVIRKNWQLTLVNSQQTLSAGESVVSTLTADQNVGLTNGKYAMYIVDMNSGNVKARCSTGTVCRTTSTWAGAEHGYAIYGFVAAMGDPQTYAELTDIQAGQGSAWLPISQWEVDVDLDRTEMGAGDKVTITATANQNVGQTGGKYAIYIYEGITGRLVKTCSSGTTCVATDSFYGSSDPFYVPYSYFALVAPPGAPASYEDFGDLGAYVGISPWERVERLPWELSLDVVGISTIRITSNQDLGKTGGKVALYMFDGSASSSDPVHGQPLVGTCYVGKICLFSTVIAASPFFWVAPRPAPQGTNDSHISCCVFATISHDPPPLPEPTGPVLDNESAGGGNASENPCQCAHADPVNTATGEFYLPANDLTLGGTGPGLTLSRTYSTANAAADGLFGYGWVSNLNTSLRVVLGATGSDPRPREVEITQENGATVLFTKVGTTYASPARVLANLEYDAGSQGWTFTRNSEQSLTFDGAGRLLTVSDQYGNALSLVRNSSGQVTSVTGSGGRSIDLTWSGGHVIAAEDSAGRTSSYEYDPEGNLITAVGPAGGISRYTYDSDHFMTTLNEPGDAVTSNSYDSTGRLIEQTDPMGRVTSFAYSEGTATITSPDGSQTVEEYRAGLLVSQTRGFGTALASTTTFEYDDKLNITRFVDALGGVTAFTYDPQGNTLSKTDALGNVSYWTYNAEGRQTSFTDPLGRMSTATYDANGQISTSTSPGGRVTSWTYNADGTVASMTMPTGALTQFAYDTSGRLISTTDPEERVTTFAYDAAGNPITTTGPDGQSATSAFDSLGRLVSVTDPLGNATTYTYDAAGYTSSITDPNEFTRTSIFDLSGRVLSSTDAAGKVTLYGYDAGGRVNVVTDANNNSVSSSYDVLGQVTSVTNARGKVTQYTYNKAGWRTATILPSGASTSVQYDGLGRVTSIEDAAGAVTAFAYDAAGQTTSVTDPLGRVTEFDYTADGQQGAVTFADGSVVEYEYTLDGKLASYTNADAKVTTYTYDLSGQPLSKTEPGGMVTAYAYDVAGRVQTVTQPDLSTTTFTYDSSGRRVGSESSVAGSTDVSLSYDPGGRVTQVVDSTGTSLFQYDEVGRLVEESDGGGAVVSYDYDDVGQLVGLTYPSGHEVSYAYDPAGNLSTVTDWLSATTSFTYTDDEQLQTETRPNGTTQVNAYDLAGRKASIAVSGPSGALASFGYSYDLAGQLIGSTTSGGAGTADYAYGYDPLSQLASVSTTPAGGSPAISAIDATPAGSLTVSEQGAVLGYNASQQLTSMTPLVGDAVSVAYDARGSRVSEVSASASSSYSFTPDAALAGAITPSGTVAYTSDARGLRQSRSDGTSTDEFVWSSGGAIPLLLTDGGHEYIYGASITPLAQVDSATGAFQYLSADILGSVRVITDDAGVMVGASTFSAFGSRTVHTGTADSAFGFTGNWTDPITGFIYLRARDYDPRSGQFLTVDPAVDPSAVCVHGQQPAAAHRPDGAGPVPRLA